MAVRKQVVGGIRTRQASKGEYFPQEGFDSIGLIETKRRDISRQVVLRFQDGELGYESSRCGTNRLRPLYGYIKKVFEPTIRGCARCLFWRRGFLGYHRMGLAAIVGKTTRLA